MSSYTIGFGSPPVGSFSVSNLTNGQNPSQTPIVAPLTAVQHISAAQTLTHSLEGPNLVQANQLVAPLIVLGILEDTTWTLPAARDLLSAYSQGSRSQGVKAGDCYIVPVYNLSVYSATFQHPVDDDDSVVIVSRTQANPPIPPTQGYQTGFGIRWVNTTDAPAYTLF